jgi:hypothetical protein
MTEEERLIVEALLRDLIRLARPSGPLPLEEGPLGPDEMESLLARADERRVVKASDDRDAPLAPDQLD